MGMTALKLDSGYLGESAPLDSPSRFDRIVGGAERVGSGVGNIWDGVAKPTTDIISLINPQRGSGSGQPVFVQQGVGAGRAIAYTVIAGVAVWGGYRIFFKKKK